MKTDEKSEPVCLVSLNNLNSDKKKLRIAVFNRTFSTVGGGAERYSVALVEQLAARHDIHVFAQEINHQWPGLTYHKVPILLLKPRWINQLWFATMTWWMTRQGFDVVHSHENTWHGDVQTVHVLPVKYTLLDKFKGWRRALRWVKIASSPRLLAYLGLEHFRLNHRQAKKVVVTSQSLQCIMESSYPGCKKMLSVITPGISMPALPLNAPCRFKARDRLGLPQDAHCVLFVANDYRKKGLSTLLKSLARFPANFVVAVVGNPLQRPIFDEQINELNLQARVFFLGSLSDVSLAYKAADCLAHPTLEDTFAMVVLEAMSHGLPVVVSNASYCGISGLLQHGVNALIIDNPLDPEELHQALAQALNQPSLRKRLSKNAVDFASCYQWDQLALKQEALYLAVATNRKG